MNLKELSNLKLVELKIIAKKLKLIGYSKLNKDQLIIFIKKNLKAEKGGALLFNNKVSIINTINQAIISSNENDKDLLNLSNLIEKGKKLNGNIDYKFLNDNQKYILPLLTAIINNKLKSVELLLKYPDLNINLIYDKHSLLFNFINENKIELIKLFIMRNDCDTSEINPNILATLIINNRFDILNLLIYNKNIVLKFAKSKDLLLNIIYQTEKIDKTTLRQLGYNTPITTFKFLVENNIEIQNIFNNVNYISLLLKYTAVNKKNPNHLYFNTILEYLRIIVPYSCNQINIPDETGKTALSYVFSLLLPSSYNDICQLFVKCKNFDYFQKLIIQNNYLNLPQEKEYLNPYVFIKEANKRVKQNQKIYVSVFTYDIYDRIIKQLAPSLVDQTKMRKNAMIYQ
jgi:hypothetical protein